jgi:outer membrane immunogenic protein
MRTLILAATSLAIATAASAADMRMPPPAYKMPVGPTPYMGWSGFYVGLNAGGAVGNGRSDFSVAALPFASVNNSVSGGLAGLQVGFNWQSGAAVVGFETDFQASSLDGSLSAPCLPGLCGLALTATYEQKVPWFGTARGRVGFASSGWLIYVTGGYAYLRLETDATATAGAAVAAFSLHETRSGWTVGGGIEIAIAPGMSVKAEYLYLDFGDVSTTWILPLLPAITDDARFTMNVARLGVNYRF